MPFLHLETTADLSENSDVPDILEALVLRLLEFETVRPEILRSCHSLRSVWHVGDGAAPGFAMLTVSVLQGRSAEWRSRVADAMAEELRKCFANSLEEKLVSVLIEVREMEKESYRSV